jgi:hypothetical protein
MSSRSRAGAAGSRAIQRLALALVLGSACADLERGPAAATPDAASPQDGGDGGATPGADGAAASFATVRPLLVAGCARCHAAGQSAGGTGFVLGGDAAADHRSTRAHVDPANAAGSRLVSKAAGQGHGGGAVWRPGSPEHTALVGWIVGGARP